MKPVRGIFAPGQAGAQQTGAEDVPHSISSAIRRRRTHWLTRACDIVKSVLAIRNRTNRRNFFLTACERARYDEMLVLSLIFWPMEPGQREEKVPNTTNLAASSSPLDLSLNAGTLSSGNADELGRKCVGKSQLCGADAAPARIGLTTFSTYAAGELSPPAYLPAPIGSIHSSACGRAVHPWRQSRPARARDREWDRGARGAGAV